MKSVKEIQEVKEAMKSYNLWGKEDGKAVLLYSGSYDDCQNELEEDGNEDHPDYDIAQNTIADQWENEVEKTGYVKMADGEIITYSL